MGNDYPSDVLTNVLRLISRSDIIIFLLSIIQDLMDYYFTDKSTVYIMWHNIMIDFSCQQ